MFFPTAAGQTELRVLTLMLYVHAMAGFSNRCGRRWLSNLSRKEFRLLLKHFNGFYCFGLSGSKTKLQVLRPPAGRLHYDTGVRAQQGFAGTDVYFLDLSVWRLFSPDGGLQEQTRPPQRHSHQRDSHPPPQQHPPQPPARQLPDFGQQR